MQKSTVTHKEHRQSKVQMRKIVELTDHGFGVLNVGALSVQHSLEQTQYSKHSLVGKPCVAITRPADRDSRKYSSYHTM